MKNSALLSQLCSKELIVDPLSDDDEIRVKTLGWFHDEGWVRLEDDDRISVVNREALESLRGIMSDILEIYYLALVASETAEQGGVALKEFMKKIMKIAQDLRGSDESHPLPSLSSVTVANALARFSEMGILAVQAFEKVSRGCDRCGSKGRAEKLPGPCPETEGQRPRLCRLNLAPSLVKTSSPCPSTP